MADVPITPFLHKLQEMDPAFCGVGAQDGPWMSSQSRRPTTPVGTNVNTARNEGRNWSCQSTSRRE